MPTGKRADAHRIVIAESDVAATSDVGATWEGGIRSPPAETKSSGFGAKHRRLCWSGKGPKSLAARASRCGTDPHLRESECEVEREWQSSVERCGPGEVSRGDIAGESDSLVPEQSLGALHAAALGAKGRAGAAKAKSLAA